MRRKGFTLIELIVVIAIIAILAAIIAPNAFKAVEKAKISGSIEDFRSIKTGAMAFYSDTGVWPSTCTSAADCAGSVGGFVSTPSNPAVASWDGPYLEKWPQQAKWSGNYTWTSASGTTFGLGNVGQRNVRISLVPLTAADKIDRQIDGANNTTSGDVRYDGTATAPTSVDIVVSRDGPVS